MASARENRAFAQIGQTIAPQSRLLRVWPLRGGISAEMIALEVEGPDGQIKKMIVRRPGAALLKRNPKAAETEFRLLQMTCSLGLATPSPYVLDQSSRIFAGPYLILEYIEGEVTFSPAHLDDYLRQLAGQLARIHAVTASSHDLSFLPEPKDKCAEPDRERTAQVGTELDDFHIRAALDSIPPSPQRNAAALLHGDFWPGNTLWRAGKLVAVIDWEDAGRGDPLLDFARSRSEIVWIYGVEAMHTFSRHYQSLMAIDFTDLPYWDLCAALRLARLAGADLAGWAAFVQPYGRDDITKESIRENYQFFVRQALDKLAI